MTTEEEEPIGDYMVRIYNECKTDDDGNDLQVWHFVNWVLKNYPEIMDEFNEYDMMMSGQ